MKFILQVICVVLTVRVLNAQQIAMFSHYFYKPMVYNPAFTGTSDAVNLMLINRTQWTGFKGAPQYNILTLDGGAINKNTGLGLSLISDKKGVTSRIGASFSYSYKLVFNKNMHLRLGISAGVVDQTINYSKVFIENANDPSLFTNSQHKTAFDANAGLAFVWRKLECGFSVPQFSNNKINYISVTDTRTSYVQTRHYISSLKYKVLISDEKAISFSPLALVRYIPNAPLQYDVNLNIDWQNKLWFGGTYKSNYAIGVHAGIVLFKNLSVGYSYDVITGNIGNYSGLSHEIMLNYKFKKNKKEFLVEQSPEDEDLKTNYTSKDLNKLIIQQLLKKVEYTLDKGNATTVEINELLSEIASFLDSESSDSVTQNKLQQGYKDLNRSQSDFYTVVRGKIVFDNDMPKADDKPKITIVELGTKQLNGIYTADINTGKYFLILQPGKKYMITVECKGYKTYSKSFSTANSKDSYEMFHIIQLNK